MEETIKNFPMENDIKEIKDKIEKERDLAYYEGEDKVISSIEFKKEIDEKRLAPTVKIDSGIPDLDKLIDGFQAGEVIVVSGPTKQGKTSLSHLFTKNFEEQGVSSLWFSFEVTAGQLFEKFALAKEFFLPRKLKQKSLSWIEDRVIEAKAKFNTRVVFIDHLHYIVDMEKLNHNASIEIGTVMRTLKSMAVDLNIVIFLMAHMTKTKYDERPTEDGLRDSSFITQEADKTLLVWRERKKTTKGKDKGSYDFSGKTLLIISNDRRSGTMGKWVELMFKDNQLQPYADGYDEELKKATGEEDLPSIGF